MSRIATLEQSIPESVRLQKAVIIDSLKTQRDNIDNLIAEVEKAQTLEEVLSNVKTTAKNMI